MGAKLIMIRGQFLAKGSLSSMTQMLSLLPWSRAPCSFECSVRAISLSCLHLMLGGRGMSATSGWQKHVTHFLCHFPPPFAGFAKRLSACTATLSPVSLHLPRLTCPCLSAEKLGDKSKVGT